MLAIDKKHVFLFIIDLQTLSQYIIAPSSNGKTLDFGSRNWGSNPCGATKKV
jgi:hypothetical protein